MFSQDQQIIFSLGTWPLCQYLDPMLPQEQLFVLTQPAALGLSINIWGLKKMDNYLNIRCLWSSYATN